MKKSQARARAKGAVADPADLRESRLRFVEARLERERGSRVAVIVTLALEEEEFEGRTEGVGLEVVELRLAAEATLEAIAAAVGGHEFRLLGIKKLRAFDADVVLAVLRDNEGNGSRFVGAVPVRSTSIAGAATAVLDALNRTLSRA